MARARFDLVRRVRKRMDALDLAVQGKRVEPVVRRLRRAMIWVVRRWIPTALERRELAQAQRVMADSPEQPITGPKVLVMSFRAWTSHVAWETTIAQGLRHRGARCEFFMCGGGLPICEIGWAANAQNGRSPCDFCAPYVDAMVRAAKFPLLRLDDIVSPDEQRAIAAEARARFEAGLEPPKFCDLDVEALVEQSLIWHFRRSALPDTPEVRQARRDFLIGAAILASAAGRLLDRVKPEVVFMVNGQFFEERIVREEAAARGIRVVTYEAGNRFGSLFFSERHDSVAADLDISDLWASEGDRTLDATDDAELEELLSGRRRNVGIARQYYRRATTDVGFVRPGQRLIALFSNVSWDTSVTGKSFAFENMFEWVDETIRLVADRDDVALVIRAHPAESRFRGLESLERVVDYVAATFPELPSNVRLVGPDEAIDSYAVMDAADAVFVFASTVGLEAACDGKPVVVAGKAHYRGRGFTIDIEGIDQYRVLFEDLSWLASSEPRRARARKYAHLFFLRAMLPFTAVVEEEPSEPIFTFESVGELVPGRDPVLDRICDGILHGGPIRLESGAPI